MIRRAKPKLMFVPWNADALADALFETEDFAQAQFLARALAIKMLDETKAGNVQAVCPEQNKVEERAQEKTLAEALLRQWMRPLLEQLSEEGPLGLTNRYQES